MRKIRLIPIKEKPKDQTPIIQTLELEESIDLSSTANLE